MKSRIPVVVVLFALAPLARGQSLTPTNPGNVYKTGEKISWKFQMANPAQLAPANATYILKQNGLTTLSQGALTFDADTATIETTLNEPGAIFLEIRGVTPAAGGRRGGGGAGGNGNRILAGALVSPELIKPTAKRPDDFDAFWQSKIEMLNKVPPEPKLEKTAITRPPNVAVDYYKITLNNINNTHIQGQLARPAETAANAQQKFPALLILQWAGIYSLPQNRVTDRAAQGWLCMNIEPHDIPFDQPDAYYTQLQQGPLGNYYKQNTDDRDKCYFLGMYLSCYRAVEYLASRPDWDGKTLVVNGTSMGGQQSLMIAGLNQKVTALSVLVPSSCDAAGPTNGRAAGFPDWAAQAKNNPKILETAAYFDPVNFASKIKCPSLVSMGLYDETSPPVGVYAAFNQIQSDKKEALPIASGHQDVGGSQRAYNTRSEQWLAALVKGQSVPPGK